MLLSQISPGAKQKTGTEFKIDFKIFGFKKSTTNEKKDLIQKLEAVVDFIHAYGNLGTVDNPDSYFTGTMPMKWGPYSDSFIPSNEQLIYFGGVTDSTILGLGGSKKHLIGFSGDSNPHSHSAMPFLIGYLEKELGIDTNKSNNTIDTDSSLVATHLATTQMKGTVQNVEFMAKRLSCGTSPFPQRDKNNDMKVLLGTPLYIASID